MPLTYFRPRGDLKSNWESANPILKLREMGLEWETTVGVGRAKVKFGDGTSAWNSLDYAIDVESTIQSDTKSNWTSNNPVLQSGQIGLEWETTVGVGEINIKVGDGATAWNSLGYGFTYDITNKEIKTITEYSGSEENPKLEDGDTLSEVAGKLNKQNDFLKTTLGYERLDAMAETLGGLSNEDFMGVMEKLNSLKFNKSDVYNGTDSTSTTLAASANALKTVKDLADSNASDIAELNSDFQTYGYKLHRILTADDDLNDITQNGIYYYYTEDVPLNAPYENASIVEVFGSNSDTTQKVQRVTRYGISGYTSERTLLSNEWLDWVQFVTNADIEVNNITSGFVSGASNIIAKIARFGPLFLLDINVELPALSKAEDNTIILTLAEEYRPRYTVELSLSSSQSQSNGKLLRAFLDPNGILRIWHVEASPQQFAFIHGTWIK